MSAELEMEIGSGIGIEVLFMLHRSNDTSMHIYRIIEMLPSEL